MERQKLNGSMVEERRRNLQRAFAVNEIWGIFYNAEFREFVQRPQCEHGRFAQQQQRVQR